MAKAKAAQTSDLLPGAGRNHREIVSPEGVPLSVELADFGERAVAFTIDFILLNAAILIIYVPLSYLRVLDLSGEILTGVMMFIAFLVRNTYFLHFELAWRGATPGKRITGLRVIDRRGGPLLPSAVIARNLTREFEVFMPLIVLLSIGGVEAGNIAQWLSFAWILAIGAIPFLNRDRMRGGDLIAGTMVIALPRRALLTDLAQSEARFGFTDKHLTAYGAYELHVLEELLRGAETAAYSPDMLRQVGEKIRRKIGWSEPVALESEMEFLRDFYTAERAFLEREQLFGKTRADKHSAPVRRV